MPLVVATLTSSLTNIFLNKPSSVAESAKKIAKAYDDYAKMAMAPPGMPIFTGLEVKVFEGLILSALMSKSAPVVAAAISSGLTSYWLSPPVMFVGGPASGIVSVVPGAASIIPILTSALMNLSNTPAACAAMMATALDVATKTVLVIYATPPPPTGPPPPAMVI